MLGAGLVLVMVIQQQATARKAWPLMQTTLKRLATDEGALQLWAQNPGFHADYENQEAFLAEVRAWRPRIGQLAASEPPSQPRSSWFRSTSPWHIWAVAQGTGGGWIQFQLQRPGPFERPEGEGYTMVHFAQDWDALREIRLARRERHLGAHWQAMRHVAEQLASPEGTRQLWLAESALHTSFPTPEDLEREAVLARPTLRSLPKDHAEAGKGLAVSRFRNPFMDRLDMTWKDSEGHVVAMTWENGALVRLRNQA
ncbi:MAG TPA: hypothetical protein VJ623_11125 [Holophagaceae bacterium]|nr:hypothetical protein [Holophagaceae bacterium]